MFNTRPYLSGVGACLSTTTAVRAPSAEEEATGLTHTKRPRSSWSALEAASTSACVYVYVHNSAFDLLNGYKYLPAAQKKVYIYI
jgi:hypothetical protein